MVEEKSVQEHLSQRVAHTGKGEWALTISREKGEARGSVKTTWRKSHFQCPSPRKTQNSLYCRNVCFFHRNGSPMRGGEGSVQVVWKLYWSTCNIFQEAHIWKQGGARFLTAQEEVEAVYEDLKKMLKILQKWFSLVQVVADLVASRTSLLSIMLGSLRKRGEQMKKLWIHFLLHLWKTFLVSEEV